MADSKLSAFPVASAVSNAVIIPILQDGANKLMTLGQASSLITTLTSVSVAGAAIPLTSNIVGLTGDCVLPVSTTVKEITLVGEGAGRILAVGLLPSDGFTFVSGSVLKLIWFSTKWNVVSSNNMTVGIV